MQTDLSFFGDSLRPDPAFALQPIQVPIRKKQGPLHRLQFVIEFVGPRSLSAGTAASLLSKEWYAALGNPTAFSMSTADVEWQTLSTSTAGSYDSLAIAWDLVSAQGEMSIQSAQHLLSIAEQFATYIQRRAMPMPVPEDVPKAIAQLKKVADNFDAGISLCVLPNERRVSEFELWVWCAQLGLTPNLVEGTFEWRVLAYDQPLFSLSPLNDSESFSAEGAKRGDQSEGVLIGFNIPRCPEPVAALDGMFKAADFLADKMYGKVYDENNKPLGDAGKKTLRSQLAGAVDALVQLGFPPGSTEALRLFAD